MPLSGHPHALALAGLGLGCFHICQDDVTIELAIIDILGGRIEARASVHVALLRVRLPLLPLKDFTLGHLSVKRDDRKRRDTREFVKLPVARGQHRVGH